MNITVRGDISPDFLEFIFKFFGRISYKLTECHSLDCPVENMDIWAIMFVILIGIASYIGTKQLMKLWKKR